MSVIPAKPKPQTPSPLRRQGASLTAGSGAQSWIPAFAGMTAEGNAVNLDVVMAARLLS
jgi:hypothetical protein